MVLVAITVNGGGLTVISVVVEVTVSTIVTTVVALMYWVQNALALYGYEERVRMSASVTQAWLTLATTASRRKIAEKCMIEKRLKVKKDEFLAMP